MTKFTHVPVLLAEVLSGLDPQPGQSFVDGTVGLGGHASAILEKTSPNGRLLGIDRDERNLEMARKNLASFGDRVTLIQGSYADAETVAYDRGFVPTHGVLLDLGYASTHIEDADRGFSFQNEGPLDMRYDTQQDLRAETIVNTWSEEDLARILRTYGEERHAQRIAKAIAMARRVTPITTTTQLSALVELEVPRHGRIHPATQTFQALRIAVNDELGELERALSHIVEMIAPQGRLAIISFHSLEDRVVKNFFKESERRGIGKILTKRPLQPTREEIRENQRSRSAKLRILQIYDNGHTHDQKTACRDGDATRSVP